MYLLIILGVLAFLVIAFFATYTVVDPNKAHIVVFMGSGRKVYSPNIGQDGKKYPTSYFFIPFLMRRRILPLANVKLEIDKFSLKDKEVAPFLCEVVCWFRITQPDIAVEKLDIVEDNFDDAVRQTLEAQVMGIARASAMKQEILDIMRDRKTFGDIVENEVNGTLKEWGLEIVKLEIVNFSDEQNSEVIRNYEAMRESQISSESRKKVAVMNKDAEVSEAKAKQESGVAGAQAQEAVEVALINKDKKVNITKQQAEAEVAGQAELANKRKVEANRTLQVGNATVTKEATITEAEGMATATLKTGQAEADVVLAKGTAGASIVEKDGLARAKVTKETGLSEAEVIRQKGLSEAEAKDKMAEALKKFNEAGITLEQLKTYMAIEIAKYDNLGKALSTAKVNFNNVTGGGNQNGGLLGLFGPEGGAGFGQFLEAFKATTGKSVADVAGEVIDSVSKSKNS